MLKTFKSGPAQTVPAGPPEPPLEYKCTLTAKIKVNVLNAVAISWENVHIEKIICYEMASTNILIIGCGYVHCKLARLYN